MRTQKELSAQRLLAAAQTVASIQLDYARSGTSLARAAMAGASVLEPLRHYPARDVSDAAAQTRFYYHAHPSRRYPEAEHGHFHLFYYPPQSDAAVAGGTPFFHLAGLSLDAKGQPLRWFTTNRWVTGEHWHAAHAMLPTLAGFEVRTHGRLAPVALWLGAMVRLFEPQIATLIRRRDQLMTRHIAQQGREAAFENRQLDVVSECRIDLSARIRQLSL